MPFLKAINASLLSLPATEVVVNAGLMWVLEIGKRSTEGCVQRSGRSLLNPSPPAILMFKTSVICGRYPDGNNREESSLKLLI